jgi:hypothetical protein
MQRPHILPLHHSGAAAGLPYYVMPFVDGETLRQRLARMGPLAVGETLRLLREIADALVLVAAMVVAAVRGRIGGPRGEERLLGWRRDAQATRSSTSPRARSAR